MILNYVLPIAVQQILVSLSFILGNFMLAKSGSVDIAAIGSSNRFLFILRFGLIAFSVGNAVLSSQYIKKSKTDVGKTLITAIASSILFSLIFIVFYFANRESILHSFSDNEMIKYSAGEYIDRAIFSSIPLSVTFSLIPTFRSLGLLMAPLKASILGIFLTAILNYLLIYGYFGFGITGVAFSSIISDTLVALFLAFLMLRNRSNIFDFKLFDIEYRLVFKYLKMSLILLATNMIWSLHTMIMHNLFGRLGTLQLTAYGVVMPIEILLYDVFSAFGFTALILVGKQLAADDKENAYKTSSKLLKLALLLGGCLGAVLVIFSGKIASMYAISPSEMESVKIFLKILGTFLIVKLPSNVLYNGILQSGGETMFLLTLTVLLAWVLIIPISYLGHFFFGFDLYRIYFTINAAELCTVSLMYLRFRSKRWMRNLTK